MRATPPAPNAHPIVKFIYLEAKMQDISMRTLCTKAGVSYNTFKEAKNNQSNISLRSIEALLNTLGFTMKPTALVEEPLIRKKQHAHSHRV